MIKKLFGGINLTWKKLIIAAIILGIYTGLMAMIPFTQDTSFRDISISFECWIFFGIIIILNSKSNLDSALKCFVFFLISQPLVYLVQVPFNDMGFGIFRYYLNWIIWTLLTFPMGFIGYYIKKKNILSLIILLPMLVFIGFMGYSFLLETIKHFPHHLLSFIFCLTVIILLVLNLYEKKIYKILSFITITILTGLLIFINRGSNMLVSYKNLDEYNLAFIEEAYVSSFTSEKNGSVEVIRVDEYNYKLKISGYKNTTYSFTLSDNYGHEYYFDYYFDDDDFLVLNIKK